MSRLASSAGSAEVARIQETLENVKELVSTITKCGKVAKSVERPSNVPVRCNSTADLPGFETRERPSHLSLRLGIGVRKKILAAPSGTSSDINMTGLGT